MDVKFLAIPALSYLLGSIPFSYLITRLKTGGDIRELGSGNVGATNVMRTSGKAAGMVALALDVCKGAAAVALARWWTGMELWGAVAGFSAAAGHSFPVLLGFRGGKSVATGGGAFLVLSPLGILCSIGLFGFMLASFRIVSLASMIASASFPLFAWIFGAGRGIILWGAATALLILVRHHANIKRLFQGTERRMGQEKQ
ncbi:MAG TPA: glycerol-3-phosphate 1-O-acyltransferase PlsY [Acidobacteriota bacterium]|nr:glycerol-3-phosphate 1-O-acyltransferase PlsY [Acidobacteriota bacterium]